MKSSNFESILKRTNVRKIKPAAQLLNIGLSIGELIYPKGVAEFVKSRFFSPSCKALTNDQEQWLNRAEQFKIPFKNAYIMAWKIGEGPAILFAHGWNGRGAQFNYFFEPALKAGYSVVFFDAPAHGESGGQMSNYLEFTAAIDILLNHEVSKYACAIVGHSLGASASINQRAERKHHLPMVFVAPPFYLMELLFESFQMHGVPQRTYLKLIRELEQVYQIQLQARNPIDLIDHIDNQILIIHDKKDGTTPIDGSENVAHKYANVELFTTEGYGHNFLLRQDVVVEKALEFIDKAAGKQGEKEKLSRASA